MIGSGALWDDDGWYLFQNGTIIRQKAPEASDNVGLLEVLKSLGFDTPAKSRLGSLGLIEPFEIYRHRDRACWIFLSGDHLYQVAIEARGWDGYLGLLRWLKPILHLNRSEKTWDLERDGKEE